MTFAEKQKEIHQKMEQWLQENQTSGGKKIHKGTRGGKYTIARRTDGTLYRRYF